jgi:hypothetical protein
MDVVDIREGTHNVNVGPGHSGHKGPLHLYRFPINMEHEHYLNNVLTVHT